MERFDTVGAALDEAARVLRAQVGDATAPLAVVAPMHLNNAFARRTLADAGPQIRLYYYTPESLVRELSSRQLAKRSKRPETRTHRAALVAAAVDAQAAAGNLEPYTETLTIPGWKRVLTSTIDRLEASGLRPADLTIANAEASVVPRLRILQTVLRELHTSRERLGLAGPLAVRDAAIAGIEDPATPCNEIRGVIVFGDRDLGLSTFEPVRQWIEKRPFVRVSIAPIDNVPVAKAPSVRALGSAVRTLTVCSSADSPLGTLQQNLWNDSTDGHSPSDEVRFVRTPDEVRENEEAVRFIQDVISEGTALDRIAIVLPDDAHRESLATALGRAGIPAVWFVTDNLARGASAKFLMLALEMSAGRQGVDTWYDLLRQRRLRLKARMDELPAGRGRWRRLLATCGSYGGGANIVRALRATAPEHDDAIDRAGARSVANVIERLSTDIDGLREFDDLAGFASRCREFVQGWWRHSADRARLFDVLKQLEGAGVGLAADLEGAMQQLHETLEGTPVQQGHLSDPAVRVLPPMAAVGCDFDVVCVLGLVQGRLPRRRKPEPILNDAVITALEKQHREIHLRRDPELIEQRRFAAAICSTRATLWLSVPAFEGLAERPRIPSTFVLDALSTQLGRRASYSDLEVHLTPSGSLAHPYPDDPSRAIGAREYLVSGLANGDQQLTAQLTSHRFARNLLRLHLDLGSGAAVPLSLRTDPAVHRMPELDGEPLRPRDVASLLQDPGGYFFRRVLKAYAPRRLRGAFAPLSSWWIDAQLATALREVADVDEGFQRALQGSWTALVESAAEYNHIDDAMKDVVVELGRRQSERFAALLGEDFGETALWEEPRAIHPGLGWRVVLGEIRRRADDLLTLNSTISYENADERMAATEALVEADQTVAAAHSIDVGGRDKRFERSKYAEDFRARLELITELVAEGVWVWGSHGSWALSDDSIHKLKADVLDELVNGGAE